MNIIPNAGHSFAQCKTVKKENSQVEYLSTTKHNFKLFHLLYLESESVNVSKICIS